MMYYEVLNRLGVKYFQILLNFSNANANTFIFFKCKYFSKLFDILFQILSPICCLNKSIETIN